MDDIPHTDPEYPYRKFTMRLLFRDLRFRRGTAVAGDRLPTFALLTTEGEPTSIESLAGGKPVLLIFGSLTCPMTASAVPILKTLYREYSGRVEFVMVNVREAHPGEHYPQPATVEEKLAHARELAHFYAMPWPVVSDDIDGHLHRSLDPKPNSAFLIDADGVIVFRSLWASDQPALHRALDSAANGERPAQSESTTMLGPVARAMGQVQAVMERAGPQAVNDLWRGAFPMALAGRIATIFPGGSPDQRGIYAVFAITLLFIIVVVSIGTWLFF